MQVVHDVLGKGKKPKRIVDDGKEEKLEPLKAEVLGNLDEKKVLPEIEDQQYVENTSEEESQDDSEEVIAQPEGEEEAIPQTERKKKKKTYQDRINELVKRANDAERERNKLFTVNQSLISEMQKMQPDFQKAREDLYESKKKSAEEALAIARTDHKTAYESGDSEKLLEVSEKIADLKYELKNLESSPKPIERSVSEKTSGEVSNTPKPQVDPKALRWSQENTWFGKDVAMTGAAYGIDNELKNQGYDPTSDAYYAEIDRRMREAFPSNFEEDEPRQVVAGVNRATRSTSKRVRLSEGQIAMAQRLGVPTNEYAKFVKEQ
jgi:hypothetical protein